MKEVVAFPQQRQMEQTEEIIVIQPSIIPEQTSGVVMVESVTAIVIAFIGYRTARLMMSHRHNGKK